MNIEKTLFGGILLHTSHGKFAINGGGTMDAMETGYRIRDQPLQGMILTSEHIHRSKNVSVFANKYQIPVLVTLATWAKFGEHVDKPVLVSPPCKTVFMGLEIEFHFLRNDAVDPVYLIVCDQGKSLGIVPDGKLSRHTAEPLRHCNTVCFANRQRILPGIPSALRRRLKSVTNTLEEIESFFPELVPVFL